MAIHDMNQPAKNWLADNLENFGKLLDVDDDPSVLLRFDGGVVLELRLNELPGRFERVSVPVWKKGANREAVRVEG